MRERHGVWFRYVFGWFGRGRKVINESAGLMIAALAAAAAIWSGYEAQRGRLDALETMRIDERPYVGTSLDSLDPAFAPDHVQLMTWVKITTYGRTPAIHVDYLYFCAPIDDVILQKQGFDQYVALGDLMEATKRSAKKKAYDAGPYVLNVGESERLGCLINLDRLDRRALLLFGSVYYEDIFRDSAHYMPFCLMVQYDHDALMAEKVPKVQWIRHCSNHDDDVMSQVK